MTTIPGKFLAFDEWMHANKSAWPVDLVKKALRARQALMALDQLAPTDIVAMHRNADAMRERHSPNYRGVVEIWIGALTEFSRAFGAWEAETRR